VLLSDLRLPDKDGFELIHDLRMRTDPTLASIPAASITASRRPEDRHRAIAAGYQFHIENQSILTISCLGADAGDHASK